MLILSLLIACGEEAPTDGSPLVADGARTAEVETEATPESSTDAVEGNVLTLDDWEMAIIEPKLEELRTGVRLSGPEALGICRQEEGGRECGEFLGSDPGTLEPGHYFIRAVASAPRESTGWQFRFQYECRLTHPDDGRVQTIAPNPGTYPVHYRRLEPDSTRLIDIRVPGSTGPRDCSYTLTTLRPDGQETGTYTGTYRIPGPE